MHSIFYFCFGKYIPFMLNYAFCLFCAIFLATKKYYYERKRFISKNNFTLRVKGIPREMNITETVGRLCVKEKEWTFYYNPFSNRWHLDKGEGPPWLWQPRMFFGIRHLVSSLLFFFRSSICCLFFRFYLFFCLLFFFLSCWVCNILSFIRQPASRPQWWCSRAGVFFFFFTFRHRRFRTAFFCWRIVNLLLAVTDSNGDDDNDIRKRSKDIDNNNIK